MSHLWISNPNKPGFMSRLFSTHPPIEQRVERLIDSGRHF
jgi:heat shock protein HtpX